MPDDAKLLADYVKHGSEDAFRQLVERYLPLVYSAAIRQVGGDAHLAQDVAQRVFVDFARKAGKLSGDAPLGGWLHRHACYVAATFSRTERRRKARETQAIEMSTMQPNRESKWEDMAILLDDAINQLGKEDRTAVVLRFLEQRTFASVGQALGVTEDAAQKRVTRALDRLRLVLGRQGVTLSAAGLGVTLATQAATAVPANLAAAISSVALASAATTGGFTSTVLKIMTMTKLKIGMAGAIVVAGVATPIVLQQQSNAKLRSENEGLRQQTQTLEDLRAENHRLAALKVETEELQRLREEHAELMRLRGHAAAMRQREQELASAQAELRRTQAGAAASAASQAGGQSPPPSISAEALKPATEWNNVGITTPANAFETWNWAKAKGDAEAVAGTLVLTAEAKAKAQALLDSLPESLRAKYGSAEKMMAVMLMNTKPIVAASVLSQDEVDRDHVVIHTQWQYAEGKIGQNDWSLHREQDGWRMVIAEGLVDKLGKGLKLGGLTTPESPQP